MLLAIRLPRPVHLSLRFALMAILISWVPSVTRAVNPPAAPARHTSGPVPGYEIIRLGRGHLNRLCLAATVEGKKGLMAVDTGANFTLLNIGKYASLQPGGDRHLPSGIPTTTTMNGVKCPVGITRDFHVGNVDFGTVPVGLVAQRFLFEQQMLYQKDEARQYDGLIGENLLRSRRAVIDCSRLLLYLGVDASRKFDFGAVLTRAGWTRVPMSNFDNDFVVPCTLNGHKFRLIVDTGAPFTVVDKGLLTAAQMRVSEIPMTGGVIGRRAERMSYARADVIGIGDYTARNHQIVANAGLQDLLKAKNDASGGAPVMGLLGGAFLADNGAIIDVGEHALYLKKN